MSYILALICTLCLAVFAHRSQGVHNKHALNTTFRVYNLQDEYLGNSFFNKFNFDTYNDPTHGYVDYVSKSEAQQRGLISTTSTTAKMAADSTNVASGRGRKSIRITSQKAYNSGLFILDMQHMPAGCGTWPAYWLVGPSWPNNGEVDILEGVNEQTYDQTTLHTKPQCYFYNVTQHMTGHWSDGSNGEPAKNCDINAPGQYQNQGCPIIAAQGTYGAPLNQKGGGVFAVMWDRNVGFKMWFFPRTEIPADIGQKKPDPTTWGLPYADFPFGSNCPSNYFNNQNIVFDLTFCGDWAGGNFASGSCKRFGSDCNNFVQNNPAQMKEAYWLVNYLRVYQ